jgi:hypothetical protein
MRHHPLRRLGFLLIVPALFLAACQADIESPEPLSLQADGALAVLPADAAAVAMVDVRAMQGNEFTNVFAPGRFSPGAMTGEASARVLSFLEATGFDPETDLGQVYAATPSIEDGPGTETTVLLYGDFDRERIGDYIDTEMTAELRRGDYQGVPTYEAVEEGIEAFLALPSDELVVAAGTRAALEAALDRLAGGGSAALSSNTTLMPLVQQAANGSDAWIALAEIPGVDDAEGSGQMFDFARAVRSFSAGMDAQDGGVEGRAFLVPATGVATSDLESLARGAIAGMRVDPGLPDEGQRILDGIRIDEKNGGVSIVGFVDNATMRTVSGD